MGVFIEVLQVFVKFNTAEFGLRKVQELTAIFLFSFLLINS